MEIFYATTPRLAKIPWAVLALFPLCTRLKASDLEIRDPIHGPVSILQEEVALVEHPFFQRLRNVKQLGLAHYAFPGACHTRFLHSIGAMSMGERIFSVIFRHHKERSELARIRESFKLACLLHDMGHPPLGHSTELFMPAIEQLNLPDGLALSGKPVKNRRACHEDYTLSAITESSFSLAFKGVRGKFGVDPRAVASLIAGVNTLPDHFSLNGIDYFPVLHQLVSGEVDCDRMDYLLRDSYFCGVSYGRFDSGWLIDNMEACPIDGKAYLGISERALLAFDGFLTGRHHMFMMVYFHYRSICLEQLLVKFFQSSPDEYHISPSIESYLNDDDHTLLKVLRASSNPNAQAIVANRIPPKIFESFNDEQLAVLESIQRFLEENNLEFIRSSSSSYLSRYNTSGSAHRYPIKVIRKLLGEKTPVLLDIDGATNLFAHHAVSRLHCYWDHLSPALKKKLSELITHS